MDKFKHVCDPANREAVMVWATSDAWCDPCVASIVTALNNGGIRTVASCCGHGIVNGNIALADGRELIIAETYEQAREMELKLAFTMARMRLGPNLRRGN